MFYPDLFVGRVDGTRRVSTTFFDGTRRVPTTINGESLLWF